MERSAVESPTVVVDLKSEDEADGKTDQAADVPARWDAANCPRRPATGAVLSAAAPTRRKRAADKMAAAAPGIQDARAPKRRKLQPAAVLLDTGKSRTMCTATTLVNLRPMLYMSASMRWELGPTLGTRRGGCAAALLDESRLLVAGGNEGASTVGSTEVLDLREGRRMRFLPGPTLASQRRECAMIRLDDLRVLVVGGYDGNEWLNTTEVVYVRTMRVVQGPRLLTRRASPAVAALGATGHVLVIGGKNASGCLDSTEVLDVRSVPMAFRPGPPLIKQRAGPTAASLDGNRVLVLGGHDSTRTHNTTEVMYCVDTARRNEPRILVEPGPLLPAPRSYFAGVQLNDNNLHVIGGHDGYNYLNETDVINLDTMELTRGPRMRKRRFMCAAVALAEDRVMVVAGTEMSQDHDCTDVLALPTYSFIPAPWMPSATPPE